MRSDPKPLAIPDTGTETCPRPRCEGTLARAWEPVSRHLVPIVIEGATTFLIDGDDVGAAEGTPMRCAVCETGYRLV